jgi:hypothetical protein
MRHRRERGLALFSYWMRARDFDLYRKGLGINGCWATHEGGGPLPALAGCGMLHPAVVLTTPSMCRFPESDEIDSARIDAAPVDIEDTTLLESMAECEIDAYHCIDPSKPSLFENPPIAMRPWIERRRIPPSPPNISDALIGRLLAVALAAPPSRGLAVYGVWQIVRYWLITETRCLELWAGYGGRDDSESVEDTLFRSVFWPRMAREDLQHCRKLVDAIEQDDWLATLVRAFCCIRLAAAGSDSADHLSAMADRFGWPGSPSLAGRSDRLRPALARLGKPWRGKLRVFRRNIEKLEELRGYMGDSRGLSMLMGDWVKAARQWEEVVAEES